MSRKKGGHEMEVNKELILLSITGKKIKMNNLHIITLLAFWGLSTTVNAQSPNFIWATQMGGPTTDRGYAIAVDAIGNVYTTGAFTGTADFNPSTDPNTGTYNLTAVGNYDIFISKLDASGNFLWAKNIGGTFADYGNSITLDANGFLYITGFFQGVVDFDPGNGVNNLTSAGNKDIFVAKFNISGDFVWAKRMGGTGDDEGYDITVNAIGNVGTTGYFRYTVDFDPGSGTSNLTAGYYDVFVSMLDESGNFLWAKQMGGGFNGNGNSGSGGTGISMDTGGNVFTTGYFSGTGDFDPGAGTYNLTGGVTTDIFVSKLDASGNFVWAKHVGEGSSRGVGNDIALDLSGNVYITGSFRGTGDFNPSPFGTYSLTGDDDILVYKLNNDGDFIWAKQMGGTWDGKGTSIAVDANENVYTTGTFYGNGNTSFDFDPGLGIYNLTSEGHYDIFISKLDAAGNFLWAKRMGGGFFSENCNSLTLDPDGNIYITGSFWGTVDFDPGNSTYNLTSGIVGNTYYEDVFVEKLCQITTPTISGTTAFCQDNSTTLTASPASSYLWSNGATTQSITVSSSGNYSVTVTNESGCTAASNVITLIANPLPSTPTITSSGQTTFCEGDSVILSASSANSYQWSNGATTQSITVSSAGNYVVTVANAAGCTAASQATSVVVLPTPAATITPNGPTTFCEGNSVILTAIPASIYQWSNGATTQSITVTTSGNYSVTLTSSAGCSAASPATSVVVLPLPAALVMPGGTFSICEGSSATLTASPSNASSYQWSNGATTPSITVSSADSYWVTVTNAGCSAVSPVTSVIISPPPAVSIATSTGQNTFCEGSFVVLTASAVNTYQWNTGATTQSISVSTAGDYSVTVTNAAGCVGSAGISVSALPVATLTLYPEPTSCDNEDGSIDLSISGGSPIVSYLWSNGATTPNLSNLPGGTYSVTATDINGCQVTAEATVVGRVSPNVDLGPDITIEEGQEVILITAATGEGLTYVWSTGETTPTITVENEGDYSVTVTNVFECSASDNVYVTVITSSVVEPAGFSIAVFPNPAQEILYIKCEGMPSTMARMMDVFGRPVVVDRSFVPDDATRAIHLEKVPDGVYFLEVFGEGFRRVVTVLKGGG
ncbi:MAG: hypothetical protein H6564_01550 [Lewinellaceae bacterium]|nr:hypothetical protein [Lewinellaceae bacterium]